MESLRIAGYLLTCFFLQSNNFRVNCISWPFVFSNNTDNVWNGTWFPYSPGNAVDSNPTVQYKSANDILDTKHGIQMGIPTYDCDDGKSRLGADWDSSPINYTCFDNRRLYQPKYDVHPEYSQEYIPQDYHAPHVCLSRSIDYDSDVPTFGPHRPLWAKYGEYQFLPRQRWLHNLEHGAVAMLYHPCVNQAEVDKLRYLVTNCLARHVITPYTLLKPERPLALVTWGHRLLMSQVDPNLVTDFIKAHAKHGLEQLPTDGQYNFGLIQRARIVSDVHDTNLCPQHEQQNIMA